MSITVFADVSVRLAAATGQLHVSLLDLRIGLPLFLWLLHTNTYQAFEIDGHLFANDVDILCDNRTLFSNIEILANQTFGIAAGSLCSASTPMEIFWL